jgi:hypothetical protein
LLIVLFGGVVDVVPLGLVSGIDPFMFGSAEGGGVIALGVTPGVLDGETGVTSGFVLGTVLGFVFGAKFGLVPGVTFGLVSGVKLGFGDT